MKDFIVLGADHGGFKAKEYVKKHLVGKGFNVLDLGTTSDKPVDYPVIAKKVGKLVVENKTRGLVFCGTGTGVMVAANKVRGVRCALGYDVYSAKMSREHNDANILALRERNFPRKNLLPIVDVWLKTPFSKAVRHKRRISKIEK